MDFIWQICGAMLLIAGALIVLSIGAIIFYATVVGINSAIKELKNKKGKK